MENTNSDTPEILLEARELIGRPPPFSSADHRLILAAAEHVPRDRPISHTDSRILRASDRLGAIYGERPPPPPTPLDSRIEEAGAEEASKREEWEAAKEARDERALDVNALTGEGSVLLRGKGGPVTIFFTGQGPRSSASPNRRHVDKAMTAAQDAQEVCEVAEKAAKAARVAKNEILQARSRWRAVSHLSPPSD